MSKKIIMLFMCMYPMLYFNDKSGTSLLVSLFFFILGMMNLNVSSLYNMNKMLYVNWFNMNSDFNWSKLVFSFDYFSNMMMLLSSLLMMSCIIMSWNTMNFMLSEFYMLLMLTHYLLMVLFLSYDLSLFYMFFELMLMPMFMIVMMWGSSVEKFKAAYYLFFYTLFGSLLMLMSFFYMYNEVQSTSWFILKILNLNKSLLMCSSMIMSMMMKMPMVPFHMWLPQAHVEAPMSGSVLLAGMLLKMGGYGMVSYCVLVFYEDLLLLKPMLLLLSTVAMVYGSMMTVSQIDMKSLVAYSSMSHMGFVTMGMLSNSYMGMAGSILMMIAHGFVSSSMFMLVTTLYNMYHTSMISYYSGMFKNLPMTAFLLLILSIINLSFPYTMNFWGELYMFKSMLMLNKNIFYICVIALNCMISSVYSFNLVNKMLFNDESLYMYNKSDMMKNDFMVMLIFMMLTMFFGMYPMLNENILNISKFYTL